MNPPQARVADPLSSTERGSGLARSDSPLAPGLWSRPRPTLPHPTPPDDPLKIGFPSRLRWPRHARRFTPRARIFFLRFPADFFCDFRTIPGWLVTENSGLWKETHRPSVNSVRITLISPEKAW